MEEQPQQPQQEATPVQAKKRGRPTILEGRSMTNAERMARTREKQKVNKPKSQRQVEQEAVYLAQKMEDWKRSEAIRLERERVEDIIYAFSPEGQDGGDNSYVEDLIDEYLTPLEVQYDLIHGGWDHVIKFERFYFGLITTKVGQVILTHLGIELPPALPEGWRHHWMHDENGGALYVCRMPYFLPRLAFSEYTGNEALLVWAHRWDRYNPPATPENSQGNKRPREEDASIVTQSISWHLAERERKQAQHAERMKVLKAKYREARGKRNHKPSEQMA
jgi:hypothetical protein